MCFGFCASCVAQVRWDAGGSNSYRMGAEGARDLAKLTAASSNVSATDQERFRVGQRVQVKSVTVGEAKKLQEGHGG